MPTIQNLAATMADVRRMAILTTFRELLREASPLAITVVERLHAAGFTEVSVEQATDTIRTFDIASRMPEPETISIEALRAETARPIDPEDAAIVMRHATASGILRGRGQTPVTGHAIRRGVARALWERGVPAETIQILGRWKSLEILFGYIGAPEAKRGAAELLAG